MTHWPDLEAALQGRAGGVAVGCRRCGNGGRLDSESLIAHLAALGGETTRHVAAHATNDRAAIETPSPLPARAWRAEASRGMQSRGGQETHRPPQKTHPASPPPQDPPSPIASGADCKVREVRAGGPRPLMPSRASARRPIYLYWAFVSQTFAPMVSPPVFAPRKRRYHVARLTPRSAHGCRSVSEPARRTTPDAMPALRPPISPPFRRRAACFQSQPC